MARHGVVSHFTATAWRGTPQHGTALPKRCEETELGAAERWHDRWAHAHRALPVDAPEHHWLHEGHLHRCERRHEQEEHSDQPAGVGTHGAALSRALRRRRHTDGAPAVCRPRPHACARAGPRGQRLTDSISACTSRLDLADTCYVVPGSSSSGAEGPRHSRGAPHDSFWTVRWQRRVVRGFDAVPSGGGVWGAAMRVGGACDCCKGSDVVGVLLFSLHELPRHRLERHARRQVDPAIVERDDRGAGVPRIARRRGDLGRRP